MKFKKTNKMTYFTSWDINLLLCLLTVFPRDITEYMIKWIKDVHEKHVTDEARGWHQSLRINQKERWNRIADLSRRRKFSQMNASVPITCTLPFDGGMWRNSRDLLKMIRYFREGFIRKDNDGFTENEEVSNQIKIVNLLKEDSVRANYLRGRHSLSSIDEALEDLVHFTCGDYNYLEPELPGLQQPFDEPEWEELPYIVVIGDFKNIPHKEWKGIGWRYVEGEYPLIYVRN